MPTTSGFNSHVLVCFRKPKKWNFADLENLIPALFFEIHFCTQRCPACTAKEQQSK